MRPNRPRAAFVPALLAMALAIATTARAQDKAAPRAVPPGVDFARDVVYGKVGDVELKLNIARPAKADGPLPCVLVFHGGGWAAGDRSQHDDITWLLALRGYAAATVGYRLAPKYPMPAQVNDAKCAVRYLRANADKHGVDPERIGAIGFSAGAHLALMLATAEREDGLEGDGGWPEQSSKIRTAVSFFGPTDLAAKDLPPVSLEILRNAIGGKAEERSDAYRQGSPIHFVRADSAPMLLFQGTADPLIPTSQATAFAEAMTRVGAEGRVELLIGAGHGWTGKELARTADATWAFLDMHLAKKAPAGRDAAPATRPVGR